jgi:RNA polymerase sigma-70 factor, ECF subfamily
MTTPRSRRRGGREAAGERRLLPVRQRPARQSQWPSPVPVPVDPAIASPHGEDFEDDRSLVSRIRSGDGDAFKTLVDRYSGRLFRVVNGILNDWHRSEDVVQEVFVLVYRKLDGFDHRSSLLTWLYRIGVNTALKARKRASRQAHIPLADSYDTPGGGIRVGRSLELSEIGEKLLRCLPLKLRVVVLLREWEGLKYSEISQVLRCSRGAVEQRLHRALVELRRVWRLAGRKEWLDGL